MTVECTECHRQAPDRFFGTPREECETCHSTQSFEGAFFQNHDQLFPIFSGPHRGVWDSCSDCHVNANNFRVFSCITCHEHNREEMDDEHDDVRNYRYDSSSCYSCHPTGRE